MPIVQHNKTYGFSLVEIAIVLVIAGILFFIVMRNQGGVSAAQTKDLLATIQQLKQSTAKFREQYKGLPGDLPVASAKITSLTAADNGDGDGLISVAESNLAAKHLSASTIMPSATAILGAATTGIYSRIYLVSYAIAASGASPCGTAVDNTAPAPNITNVILIQNMPGEVAGAIDREFDDGQFSTGNVRGSSAYTSGTTVACVAVPLT